MTLYEIACNVNDTVKEEKVEPKEEKTPLDHFKDFLNLKQTHRFLGYWSKVTKTNESVLKFVKEEMELKK